MKREGEMTNQLFAIMFLLAAIVAGCFAVQWAMEEIRIRKERREFQRIEEERKRRDTVGVRGR